MYAGFFTEVTVDLAVVLDVTHYYDACYDRWDTFNELYRMLK